MNEIPTQKEMLQHILKDLGGMKKTQDHMKQKQDDMDLRLHDLIIDLQGTSRDPDRGLIPRVKQNERCIRSIKNKQYKIFVWGIVIFTIVTLIFEELRTLVF